MNARWEIVGMEAMRELGRTSPPDATKTSKREKEKRGNKGEVLVDEKRKELTVKQSPTSTVS
jgi:hypothetical protein